MCDQYDKDVESLVVSHTKIIKSNGFELFTKRNKDYIDTFSTYGIIGVLIRIQDKIMRSITLTQNGINLVQGECIGDTLLDLHNYATMVLMLMEEGRCVNDSF